MHSVTMNERNLAPLMAHMGQLLAMHGRMCAQTTFQMQANSADMTVAVANNNKEKEMAIAAMFAANRNEACYGHVASVTPLPSFAKKVVSYPMDMFRKSTRSIVVGLGAWFTTNSMNVSNKGDEPYLYQDHIEEEPETIPAYTPRQTAKVLQFPVRKNLNS